MKIYLCYYIYSDFIVTFLREGRLEGTIHYSGIKVKIKDSFYATTTNALGEYQFEVPIGNYNGLNFEKEDFNTTALNETITVVEEGCYTPPTLVLSASHYTIKGKVTLENASSYEGVTIQLLNTAFKTKTNATGEYTLNHVPIGTYQLKATCPGYAYRCMKSIEIKSDKLLELPSIQLFKNPTPMYNHSWIKITDESVVPARGQFAFINFNNRLWVMGGLATGYGSDDYKADVWSSADGLLWKQEQPQNELMTPTGIIIEHPDEDLSAPWYGRYGMTSFVFNNKIWIVGGSSKINIPNEVNDVWSSDDGIIWTEVTAGYQNCFSGRYGHTSVVFKNKMWVIGGNSFWEPTYRNDVWSSTDGINWSEEVHSAPWSGRTGHTSVVFDNKIWMIGGQKNFVPKNDVWYSADGVTWIQATALAAWPSRFGHISVVFDNKIWVIGGSDAHNICLSDVWYSSDGVTWTQLDHPSENFGRVFGGAWVMNNQLFLFGGYDNIGNKNDIWIFQYQE